MTYVFDTKIAEDHGVEAAIIYQNIVYWCKENEANKRNIFNGVSWVYNTLDSWVELFPFWSRDKIFRTLKKMEESGLIIKDFHGKNRFDRTAYYTSNIDIADFKYAYCNNQISDIADTQNGYCENQKSDIADSKYDNKEQYRSCSKNTLKEPIKYSLDDVINYWNYKGNLKKALSMLNQSEPGKMINVIQELGKEYTEEAIDNLSLNYDSIPNKFRPQFKKFILESITHWHDWKPESQRRREEREQNGE